MRPEWIVDSIKAQTLLSEEDYLLERLRGGPAQKTIHAFKQVTAEPLSEDVIYPAARPILGKLQQQQQAQAEKPQHAERHVQQQQQQQQPLPPRFDQSEVATPSGAACNPHSAAALHVPDNRDPDGNAAEPDEAESFSFMTKPSLALPGINAATHRNVGAARGGPDNDGGLVSRSVSTAAEPQRRGSNDDAGSQFGSADAVLEPDSVPEPRRAAVAARWTPEDMRVAQAAAAAARSRCDMLKVRPQLWAARDTSSCNLSLL